MCKVVQKISFFFLNFCALLNLAPHNAMLGVNQGAIVELFPQQANIIGGHFSHANDQAWPLINLWPSPRHLFYITLSILFLAVNPKSGNQVLGVNTLQSWPPHQKQPGVPMSRCLTKYILSPQSKEANLLHNHWVLCWVIQEKVPSHTLYNWGSLTYSPTCCQWTAWLLQKRSKGNSSGDRKWG